jgi:hypothetical protein
MYLEDEKRFKEVFFEYYFKYNEIFNSFSEDINK